MKDRRALPVGTKKHKKTFAIGLTSWFDYDGEVLLRTIVDSVRSGGEECHLKACVRTEISEKNPTEDWETSIASIVSLTT